VFVVGVFLFVFYLCENSRLDLQWLCCRCLWYNWDSVLHPYWEPRMLCSCLKSSCRGQEYITAKLLFFFFFPVSFQKSNSYQVRAEDRVR